MAKKSSATNGANGTGMHGNSDMPLSDMGNQEGHGMAQDIGQGMGGGMRAMSGMGSNDMMGDFMDGNTGGMPPNEGAGGALENVLVEVRVSAADGQFSQTDMSAGFLASGFQVDADFEPMMLQGNQTGQGDSTLSASQGNTVLIKGQIDPARKEELRKQPNVVDVWKDTPIAPFGSVEVDLAEAEVQVKETEANEPSFVFTTEGFGTCPIGVCDCSPGTPKGNMADVANYLGVNQIWNAGFRGEGIVVAVVDGGITAQGRSIASQDTTHPQWPNKLVPNVIGGWPTASWGTTGAAWNWHGNMCATDVLGMAPNCRLYDIRISAGDSISAALAGFQWAIDQHRANGTPHILTNSWGIFQEAWDRVYARDPNHPFTRKVVEAINEGILVLFAAGNCGGTCPDGRCGSDSGPGKSIWGANSHPLSITVGAVNRNEQFVGYSSQGPGALDANKPDFCSITHFTGFFNSDSGTSAATPIAAGVVALLKQAAPGLTQSGVKNLLRNTAKNIGAPGFDQNSGAGIIQPKLAFDQVASKIQPSGPVVAWGPNRLDAFVIGTDSALYHKWWNGSAWGPSLTGYEAMGGTIMGAPEVVSWGANRLDVFVVGSNSALYHKWWNGSAWGPSLNGYEAMGGIIKGQPKAVSWGPNRLDVFVVGTDGGLYHKWWNGSAWGPSLTGYESLGGKIVGSPEVVSWGPNRLDIFVVGTDGGLYHKWWNGSAWGPSVKGWEAMGGIIKGQPKVVSWGPNRLDVFVVGTNSALYHKWWNGSAWGPSLTGYEAMGGVIIGDPEAVSWGPNRLDVFVVGTNSALYHKWWNGSAWGPSLTGYEAMGGVIKGNPKAVAWSSNRLDVFVVGSDSALYHKWWNGSAWGPSLTGYEAMGGVITRF